MELHLSARCWCCNALTFLGRLGEDHREWCWAEGDGRYLTDDPDRWALSYRLVAVPVP